MTPMTRGSIMDSTQRGTGSNPVWDTECLGSLMVRARRDGGFEIHPTMGHYIEAYSLRSRSLPA